VPEYTELERDLRLLEAMLRTLEQEYNQYFAGQLPRPPVNTRRRVEALLRRYDRAFIQSAVDRFRLSTLQSRFSTFADLWDRGLRAKEEGRPGPFTRQRHAPPPEAPPPPRDRVVQSVTVGDPAHDSAKLEALYNALVEARRTVGTDEPFPFSRFVEVVKGQVDRLQKGGSRDVSFSVAVKDGKVAFTARGVKPKETDKGKQP
jgi:hypothetical protein